jgi:capsular exopolysaccharide synthesis family protein
MTKTGTAETPRATDNSPTALSAVTRMLRKHWSVIVACGVLAAGAGLLYSKSATKIYEASTLLEIDPRPNQPLGEKASDVLDMGTGNYWDTRDYYETQYKIIASDRVLGAVVRDLGLASDYSFLGESAGSPGATPAGATEKLRKRLTVEPIKSSRLVNIRVEDVEPARAKRITNAIADAYIDQNLRTAQTATSDAVVWLNGQLDNIKLDLDRDENALYDFKRRNDLPSTSINEASNMLRVEMQELDTALTRTRTKRQELAARHEELAKVSADNPDQLPASELLASPFLQSLRTQYQDAMRELGSAVAEGKGENHPAVKKATERVSVSKNALLAEVRNIQGAVERDLAVVTRQEAGEAGLFEEARKRAVDLNMKEIEYHRLDRARDQNEKLYATLLERAKDADLARMMKVNNIRVVDLANEPKSHVRPRASVNTMLSMLAGLVLGIALAWIREQLDSSLKTPDELEERLGVTFLGLLPELEEDEGPRYGSKRRPHQRAKAGTPKGPPELVVHERPLSGVAEAARSIRTNVMFMNPDKPHRMLLITSAAPWEGKTTVACSIAIALAQGGLRVCIVDCDLRRPRLHRIFDRVGDAGVTNVIVGEAALEDVAKPTVVDNLWSIPAGPTPPNPADLLHSSRFRKFIDDLSKRFDRVVIDSPPIVAVTDPAIISTLVDGTIFVVRAFKTSKHLTAQGLRSLRDVDAPIVGAVLNAVNLKRAEYGYYQNYYYYKSEGYQPLPQGSEQREDASPPN